MVHTMFFGDAAEAEARWEALKQALVRVALGLEEPGELIRDCR
jgi:cystathionine beta-lyase/cystathionine gamma-synthase